MKMVPTLLLLLIYVAVSPTTHAANPEGGGPLPAIAHTDPGLPAHTIYRPRDLQGTYPVVLWGNGATYSEARGGAFAAGPLAWLQWRLQDDAEAARMFTGAQCGYCAGTSSTKPSAVSRLYLAQNCHNIGIHTS